MSVPRKFFNTVDYSVTVDAEGRQVGGGETITIVGNEFTQAGLDNNQLIDQGEDGEDDTDNTSSTESSSQETLSTEGSAKKRTAVTTTKEK